MPTGHSSVKCPHGFSGVLYMIGRNRGRHKTTTLSGQQPRQRLPG